MNPFQLKDNALFLSCWHERNRPIQLICYTIFIIGILLLTFFSIALFDQTPNMSWLILFYVLTTIQAVALLLIGSLFASSLSSRERTCATLDFHRNSPQPVIEKIIGLVLGATWFEWSLFLLLFVIELPFAILPQIALVDILLFNASLMLTGIFFQTTASMLALLSPQKKRGSPFALLFLLLFLGWPLVGFIFASSQSSFFAHLFGATVLKYIYHEPFVRFNGWFYHFQLPLILLQGIVQLPLILLMIKGLKRIFNRPNSPAWSKLDVIGFFGFIFFMITGFFVANYSHFNIIVEQHSYGRYNTLSLGDFTLQSMGLFIILFAAIGFFIGFFTVPSYFKRTKYLILSTKKSSALNNFFNDGATSLPTILIYLAIGTIFMLPYIFLQKIPIPNALAILTMLSSHIIAFAGFLEFFRLSRFRSDKVFFVTTLIVLWVFVPWLVSLACGNKFETMVNIGTLSPFVGIAYIFTLISAQIKLPYWPLFLPCLTGAITWLLAWREHQIIKQKIKYSQQ